MKDVPNYEATVDFTDTDEVQIDVGAGDSGQVRDDTEGSGTHKSSTPSSVLQRVIEWSS